MMKMQKRRSVKSVRGPQKSVRQESTKTKMDFPRIMLPCEVKTKSSKVASYKQNFPTKE